MQQPPTASESEASQPITMAVSVLPRRSLLGVAGLVLLTVGSLGLAWCFPDMTLMHFLWVAQVVPVLYLILAWWGTQPPHSHDAS
jgi:NADH:ubiquinone oxidoreductase subunit 4 (subunit M)